MSNGRPIHPILTCAEAAAWEKTILGADPEAAWAAMVKAGAGVGAAILRDYVQWRPLPRDPRVLVLAGPGHNGGDAILAAREILRARPRGKIMVVLLEPAEKLKSLTQRAWDELAACSGVESATPTQFYTFLNNGQTWDMCIGGLYGMSFRPPLSAIARELIQTVNNAPQAVGFRAAVDLPSGVGDTSDDLAFVADFTYATGIAKKPLLEPANSRWVGRIRYIDLGFFEKPYEGPRASAEDILLAEILNEQAHLRDARGDKRSHGHLLVVSGSRSFPGAQMLNVMGALRSGVGLVTALTPMSHAPAFAAVRPEAMWRGCAEESDGGHGTITLGVVRELAPRMTAVMVGSGMGARPGYAGHAAHARQGLPVADGARCRCAHAEGSASCRRTCD